MPRLHHVSGRGMNDLRILMDRISIALCFGAGSAALGRLISFTKPGQSNDSHNGAGEGARDLHRTKAGILAKTKEIGCRKQYQNGDPGHEQDGTDGFSMLHGSFPFFLTVCRLSEPGAHLC